MIEANLKTDDLEDIPDAWREHNLSAALKDFLGSQHPQARGGEDLPDLQEGEVEIARLSLLNSVHGEVTSLRAKYDESAQLIRLSMVDEYENEYALKKSEFTSSLSAREVLAVFADADPSPVVTSCRIGFTSYYYPDIGSLADEIGVWQPCDDEYPLSE
jgi:hypothetical protein